MRWQSEPNAVPELPGCQEVNWELGHALLQPFQSQISTSSIPEALAELWQGGEQ